MSMNERKAMPALSLDLSSASGANIRIVVDFQMLADNSLQSEKRRCHWLDLPKDDDPRPRSQFPRTVLDVSKRSSTCR